DGIRNKQASDGNGYLGNLSPNSIAILDTIGKRIDAYKFRSWRWRIYHDSTIINTNGSMQRTIYDFYGLWNKFSAHGNVVINYPNIHGFTNSSFSTIIYCFWFIFRYGGNRWIVIIDISSGGILNFIS